MMELANEENRSPQKSDMSKMTAADVAETRSPSSRRVLADVSPNVKLTSTTPAFMKKAVAGSPLKRSFTAAMEGGDGFTYLKRRRLREDEVFSEVDEGSFRPVFESAEDGNPVESLIPHVEETTPTEPNTPCEEGSDTQGSSAERKSFSSLINYDPSSQTSHLIFKTISDAEMLRLRLRVAMYKVRTNQVDIPFSDLHVESHLPPPTTRTAVEEAVAELRREAQEVAARQTRPAIPKLLPAPVLQPTAYSSRMIKYETNLPSSPPVSLSPDKLPTISAVATPLREVRQMDSSASSPRRLEGSVEELTSSVVKGRVAEGLLGLRNAV